MAYRIMKQIQTQLNVPGDTTTHVIVFMECDTLADLPASPTAISGLTLEISSRAHIIQDNTRYCMQADGTWQLQDQSPFSDVYTKSEVDALLASMQYEIDSFYKYFYAVSDIINYGIIKNYFTSTQGTQTITDVTFTANGDGTWSTSGTAAARRQYGAVFTMPANLPDAVYKLTGCPQGGYEGGVVKYCLYIWDNTTGVRVSQNDTGEGVEFQWTPDPTHSYNLTIDIRSGTNANDLLFKPMITFKTYDDVTDAFRPHP